MHLLIDPFARAYHSICAFSVTDRCDSLCFIAWSENMTFLAQKGTSVLEELDRAVHNFVDLGVQKAGGITGGRALVRKGIHDLLSNSMTRPLDARHAQRADVDGPMAASVSVTPPDLYGAGVCAA